MYPKLLLGDPEFCSTYSVISPLLTNTKKLHLTETTDGKSGL